MYLLTRKNRVIHYCDEGYHYVGSTVICESKGLKFEDAIIVYTAKEIPSDISKVSYDYVNGEFVKSSENLVEYREGKLIAYDGTEIHPSTGKTIQVSTNESVSIGDILYVKEDKDDITGISFSTVLDGDYETAVSSHKGDLLVVGANRKYNYDLELFSSKNDIIKKIENNYISALNSTDKRKWTFSKNGEYLLSLSWNGGPENVDRAVAEIFTVSGEVITKSYVVGISQDLGDEIQGQERLEYFDKLPFCINDTGTLVAIGRRVYEVVSGKLVLISDNFGRGNESPLSNITALAFDCDRLLIAQRMSYIDSCIHEYYPLENNFHSFIGMASYDISKLGTHNGSLWYVTDLGFYYNASGIPTVSSVNDVLFSPDGRFVIARGSEGYNSNLYYIKDDNTLTHLGAVNEDSVSFSKTGNLMAVSLDTHTQDKALLIYRLHEDSFSLEKEYTADELLTWDNSYSLDPGCDCLQVFNRTQAASGAQMTLPEELGDANITIKITLRSVGEKETFRLFALGNFNGRSEYKLTADEGEPFAGSNEWKTYEFNIDYLEAGYEFVLTGLKIHGGCNNTAPYADFYIADIAFYGTTGKNLLYRVDFSTDHDISNWTAINGGKIESFIKENYLGVTDRSGPNTGVLYNSDIELSKGQTYNLSMDLKCDNPAENFRLYMLKGTAEQHITYQPYNKGVPVVGRPGWYRFSFDYIPTINHTFGLKLQGYNDGSIVSKSNFYIDNVVLKQSTNILYKESFDRDSSIIGWSSFNYIAANQTNSSVFSHYLEKPSIREVNFMDDMLVSICGNGNILSHKIGYNHIASRSKDLVNEGERYYIGVATKDRTVDTPTEVSIYFEGINESIKDIARSHRVTLKGTDQYWTEDTYPDNDPELKSIGYNDTDFTDAAFVGIRPDIALTDEWKEVNQSIIVQQDKDNFELAFRGTWTKDDHLYNHAYEIKDISIYETKDTTKKNLIPKDLDSADILMECSNSPIFVIDNGEEKYIHISKTTTRDKQARYYTGLSLKKGDNVYTVSCKMRKSPNLITQEVTVPGVRKGDIVISNTDHRIYSTDTTVPVYSIASDDNKVVFACHTLPNEDITADIVVLSRELSSQINSDHSNSGYKVINYVSPTMKVEKTKTGYRVILTDSNGTQEFELLNGREGDPGRTPTKGVDYYTPLEKRELISEIKETLHNESELYIGEAEPTDPYVKIWINPKENIEFVDKEYVDNALSNIEIPTYPNGDEVSY